MVYENNTMKLRKIASTYSYTLFERLETGDNSTQYWVIAWCPKFDKDKVSWANGHYFEGSETKAKTKFWNFV